MTPRFITPALVAIGILVASAAAYAQVGGGSHGSLLGAALEETQTETATATATETVLAEETATETPTATETAVGDETPTPTATPADGEDEEEEDTGNHEDGILGIPSDDSPACQKPGADGEPRGCIIMTTPSGVQVRVPNSPGHQKHQEQEQEQNEDNSPGRGLGHGNGAGGNGGSGAED